ncbi:MAG: GrpB family protein [Candidatus Bathyarchaeia archaeon]
MEHIGSPAILGIVAKPIIDIMVVVAFLGSLTYASFSSEP